MCYYKDGESMKKWFSILLIIVLVLIGTSCFVYDYLYNTECILLLKENREVPLKKEEIFEKIG